MLGRFRGENSAVAPVSFPAGADAAPAGWILALQETRCLVRAELVPDEIEICQRKQREELARVLRQPAIAHLRVPPQALHHAEGMLAARPHALCVLQIMSPVSLNSVTPEGLPVSLKLPQWDVRSRSPEARG